MPKSVRKVKNGNVWKREVVATKHRIGTRKSGKSANLMSNDELHAIINDNSKRKYWGKAQAVILNRL